MPLTLCRPCASLALLVPRPKQSAGRPGGEMTQQFKYFDRNGGLILAGNLLVELPNLRRKAGVLPDEPEAQATG